MKKYFCIWLALSCCAVEGLRAQGQQLPSMYIYENLSHQWLVYDYQQQLYVPYLPFFHEKTQHYHLILKRGKTWQSGEKLILTVREGNFIFINNNLAHYFQQPQTIAWDLDSLSIAAGQVILLTYQGKQLPNAYLGSKRYPSSLIDNAAVADSSTNSSFLSAPLPTNSSELFFQARLRPSLKMQNNFLVITITYGFLLSILAMIDKHYVSIIESVRQLIMLFKFREIQEKVTTVHLLTLGGLFAATMAYLLSLITNSPHSLLKVTFIHQNQPFILVYLQLFGWILAAMWIKYAIIRFLRAIFEHHLLADKHTSISIHFYKLFALIIFILFTFYQLNFFYQPSAALEVLCYVLAGGWVLITVGIMVMLYLSVKINFVYLIVYLCATEVIPLAVTSKLFLISS